MVVISGSISWAATERLVLVAGGGAGSDGSPAIGGRLDTPFGVAFDRSGNMFVVEYAGQRVRKVDRRGILTTIAGTGVQGDSGDGGPAIRARFNHMHSLAVARDGAIYIADTDNHRIRKIDPRTTIVTAFAGSGHKSFGGDGGQALQAEFGGVYCVALDPTEEHLFLADLDNRRVRAVDLKTGIVSTIAGNGQRGVPRDGSQARLAPLVDPRAVAADDHGNVYILERAGHALRVVDVNGKIRTVAGIGRKGMSGDGGPALRAGLNEPKHLCIDGAGNVLIADTGNDLIRKYVPLKGTIVRVAGNGTKGSDGLGGDPLRAALNQPHGVYCHAFGAVYIVDSYNNRVLKIEP
jgi:NHL repeat